jgi:signal transduction histidine kinase
MYRLTARLALVLALLALLGWMTGFDPLKSWVPGWTTQTVNTALAIAGLAIALDAIRMRSPLVAGAGAGLTIALAGSALLQRITGLDLGIDQLFAADPTSEAAGQPPGRMAAGTALSLLLVAAALGAARAGRARTSQVASAIALAIAWIAMLGYAHELGPLPAEWLYGSVSLPTAMAVGLLALGSASLLPREGYLPSITGDDRGAALLRTLGPAALLLPGVTAVARHQLERIGDPGFLAVIGATFDAVVFAALLALTARETRRADAETRELSRRLIAVQEAERRALATELHDELGQTLTALGMLIDRAARKPEARVEARELVSVLTEGVRGLALELRPSMLDDLGLVPALEWLVARWASQVGIAAEFTVVGKPRRVAAQVETAAYRIVQEALTNAARHSDASRVGVSIAFEATAVRLVIDDDGHGFDAAHRRQPTLGLAGMAERAKLAGGQCTVSSDRTGTVVRVSLPALPSEKS